MSTPSSAGDPDSTVPPVEGPSANPPRSTLRRLVVVVVALFFCNGAALGVWGGSMAALRARVGTDEAGIAMVLMVTGLAAILSMQIAGRLADRYGAMAPSFGGGIVVAFALMAVGWAPTYAALVGTGVLMGLGNGAMDVCMNLLAVKVEKTAPRPLMSRFHATFSIGSFIGAGAVLSLDRVSDGGLTWGAPTAMALITGLVLTVMWRAAPPEPRPALEHEVGRGRVPAIAWALGVMALAFGLTEGTALDWSSIHVTDVAGVSPGTGAVGLVAVSATMVLIRLVGDHLVEQFGRTRVVQAGSAVAMAGYLVTLTVTSLIGVVGGWLLVGLGVGMIAPQIYALAGYIGGGRVLAIVSSFGYAAFLGGPAIIGFVAKQVGIQTAMVVPLGSALLLIVFSMGGVLRRAEAAGHIGR